jgi:hypothetical protein
MSILGWVHGDAWRPLSASDAFDAVRDTWVIFRRLGLISTRAPWDAPDLPPSDAGIRLARAALLGQGDPSSPARSSDDRWPAARAVQLTVILRDIEPPIWRRLLVPATMALRELHGVIQTAMGWEDYHLHMFDIDGVLYGHVEEIEDEPLGDEATFTVGQAAGAVSEFSYEYDFGDRWRHDIRIEQVTASVGMVTPQLIDGARACPPEDCGGSSGYAHLLEVLADPTHKDHNLTAQWVGGAYDPEAFDLAEPNASLELYDRVSRQRRLRSR